jgi:hypothetical protein
MKKWMLLLAFPIMFSFTGCMKKAGNTGESAAAKSYIQQTAVDKVVKTLADKYGETEKPRIERGVAQTAALWRESDGKAEDFEKFCTDNFVAGDTAVGTLFNKLQTAFEILNGNFNKMGLDLRIPLDLIGGDVTPIDEMLGAYSPSAHLSDDFFQNKVAFVTILNFPFYPLKEKTEQGNTWSRKQWAYARMGDMFTSRVPAELLLKISESLSNADSYISSYNIMMGNLVDNSGKTLFPADMKLITHWGIRDELKSNYAAPGGLVKQKMIYSVMKHIIDQSIPQEVINNGKVNWNPETNKVYKDGKEMTATPEPDTRYQHLLNNFQAEKAVDPFYPGYPTYISRAFDLGMEIPREDVEKLFVEFMTSPQVKQVADLISKRLGRKLEPFDIWYDGFKARSTISEDMLSAKTGKLYPNAAAFERDLPSILIKLGWKPERAKEIAAKVQVDPARGSGHAAGAYMKSDKARLRTRIMDNGMNYKGYNIAVHEFGHNVEQTMDLHNIDYYMLSGVPNTAFTEALAFIFQKRDLDLLGIRDNNPEKEDLLALDNFWMSYEIMGVGLVDMNVWKWMYANPEANPAQLKEAVITIAKETWNKYYAPVFGMKDEPILAIYSHMIDNPLYLSNYPVGHLIDFQIEKQITGKPFASEVERIYEQGRLIPQVWMKGAVGREISIQPILDATTKALTVVK